MSEGGRIYGDKFTRTEVKDDHAPEDLEKIRAAQSLQKDLKDPVVAPPTRMQRKFNRIFGAGKDTSNMMVTGF